MIDQIKKIMIQVNAECFQNQLTLDFPVKLSNRAHAAGHVSFSYNRFSGLVKVTGLAISKNFNWTEKLLKDVIAHELIHVFEIQVLKVRPAHGYAFLKEMNRINKVEGYTVDTTHSEKTTKEKSGYYILSSDCTKFAFVTAEITTHHCTLERVFGLNYTVGHLKTAMAYKVQRGSLKATYRMTEERLKELGIEQTSKMAA